MLLALLLLIGATTAMLLVTWLTMQIFVKQVAVPVQLEEVGTGDGNPGGGSNEELEPPPPEEVNFEPPVEDPMTLVDNVIASRSSVLDDFTWEPQQQTGKGKGRGRGIGDGVGDGTGGRPRHWEVQFPPGNTLAQYARQLDYFRIELGLLAQGKVTYALNFSKNKPDTRTGPADAEKRYYLTWRRGRDQLQEADRDLLTRAGIDAQGKMILKFIPQDLEVQLATLEKQRAMAAGKQFARKTLFEVRPQPPGWTFVVAEQWYE